jgi:hypothetical protein
VPLPRYEVVATPARVAEVCPELMACSQMGLAITAFATTQERNTLSPIQIRLIHVAAPNRPVVLFDLVALGGLPPALGALLSSPIRKFGFNPKLDAGVLLRSYGVEIGNPVSLLAGSVLASGYADDDHKGEPTLEREVELHLGLALRYDNLNWGAPYLTREQLDCAAREVAVLVPLHDRIMADAKRAGIERAWGLECAVIPAVVAMEAAGFPVDRGQLEALVTSNRAKAASAEERARQTLGWPLLNLNCRDQILDALEQTYGVRLNSTSKEALLPHVHAMPALEHVLAWRHANGRAATALSLIKSIGSDGHIRATFDPLGARTGRFVSAKHSLHNIPRDEAFRRCFIACEGHKLIVADYHAIQLRIAAYLTSDRELTLCFISNPPIDPHRRTASAITGVPMELITKEKRQLAKAVNFGFVFGMGPTRFISYAHQNFGIVVTKDEAQRFREGFLALYSGIRSWHDRVSRECDSLPGVRTASGRLRLLPDVSDRYTKILATPVQGTEADGNRSLVSAPQGAQCRAGELQSRRVGRARAGREGRVGQGYAGGVHGDRHAAVHFVDPGGSPSRHRGLLGQAMTATPKPKQVSRCWAKP